MALCLRTSQNELIYNLLSTGYLKLQWLFNDIKIALQTGQHIFTPQKPKWTQNTEIVSKKAKYRRNCSKNKPARS